MGESCQKGPEWHELWDGLLLRLICDCLTNPLGETPLVVSNAIPVVDLYLYELFILCGIFVYSDPLRLTEIFSE